MAQILLLVAALCFGGALGQVPAYPQSFSVGNCSLLIPFENNPANALTYTKCATLAANITIDPGTWRYFNQTALPPISPAPFIAYAQARPYQGDVDMFINFAAVPPYTGFPNETLHMIRSVNYGAVDEAFVFARNIGQSSMIAATFRLGLKCVSAVPCVVTLQITTGPNFYCSPTVAIQTASSPVGTPPKAITNVPCAAGSATCSQCASCFFEIRPDLSCLYGSSGSWNADNAVTNWGGVSQGATFDFNRYKANECRLRCSSWATANINFGCTKDNVESKPEACDTNSGGCSTNCTVLPHWVCKSPATFLSPSICWKDHCYFNSSSCDPISTNCTFDDQNETPGYSCPCRRFYKPTSDPLVCAVKICPDERPSEEFFCDDEDNGPWIGAGNVTFSANATLGANATVTGTVTIVSGTVLTVYQFVPNSFLTASSCVDVGNNVTFNLNISLPDILALAETSTPLTLIASQSNCASGNFFVSGVPSDECNRVTAQPSTTTSSLSVLFTVEDLCTESVVDPGLQNWQLALIIVAALLALAAVTLGIVFGTPAIRAKVLPFKNRQ